MKLPHEQTVNVLLSQLLRKFLGESTTVIPEDKVRVGEKRGRFDIRIESSGLDFVMEAAFDKEGAEIDAKKRLNDGLINTIAVAIYYDPEVFNNKETDEEITMALEKTPLNLKIFVAGTDINKKLLEYVKTEKNINAESFGNWIKVSLLDFNSFLAGVIELIVKEDLLESLISQVENETDNFINAMNSFIKRNPKSQVMDQLNRLLFSPSEKGEEQMINGDIVYANTYISLLIGATLYESLVPTYGFTSLKLLYNQKLNPLIALEIAFEEILKIDYENIMQTALDIDRILFSIQNDKNLLNRVSNIFDVVATIVSNKALLRQDFIGRLYHKVTGDVATRKGYATFYTKPTSAVILTGLAFNSEPKWKIDWADTEKIGNFKVCDFACGSGTLLSASYGALFSLYRKNVLETNNLDLDIKNFHKTIVENSIYGFDALEHAVQIASAVLALHEPGVSLKKMNTFHIPVGQGSLGSLNLYKTNTLYLNSIGLSSQNQDSRDFKFDLVIMNPPFSRSTAPGKSGSKPSIFGFITKQKEYDKLWKTYTNLIKKIVNDTLKDKDIKKLFNKVVSSGLLSKHAMSPINDGAAFPFLFLADDHLKANGKIALVLPKAVLSNSTFFFFRALIFQKYNIDYIITSTEALNHNFSFSTDLSEILLILSKQEASSNETKTIIIKKQPKNILEAYILTNEILKRKSECKGINSEAYVSTVKKDEVSKNLLNLSLLVDLSQGTRKLINDLDDGKLLKSSIKVKTIKELIAEANSTNKNSAHLVGSRSFRSNEFSAKFKFSKSGTMKILTESGIEVMKSLKLKNGPFIKSLEPKNIEGKKLYDDCSSHIIIPGTVRFNTYPLISSFSKEKIVSSGSFMLDFDDVNLNKAISVWLNSIFMLLYLRAKFLMQEGNFGHIPSYLINSLPVPIDKKTIQKLSKIYEKYKEIEWKNLPQQLKDVLDDKNDLRLKYDLDVVNAIIKGSKEDEMVPILKELYFSLANLLST